MKSRMLCPLSVVMLLGAFTLSAQDAPAPVRQPTAPVLSLPAPSPLGSLRQRVGFTDIEITYSRPSARGRTMLGGVEPHSQVWRTGANAATKISFSTPVKLGGQAVPAGTYALFTIPTAGDWTVILSRKANQMGAFGYDPADDAVRFQVTPVRLDAPVETFEIGINDVRDDGATLNLIWERVRVPVRLELDIVGPTVARIAELMAGTGRKPYHQAAQFYYANGLDLAQALAWAEAAVAERATPSSVLLQARLLTRLGRNDEARTAARRTLELAEKSGEPIRSEYRKQGETLLNTLP